MTATEFKRWLWLMRQTRKWNQTDCAKALGCGLNQITIWKELRDPPKYIGLACAAIVKDLGPGDALSA